MRTIAAGVCLNVAIITMFPDISVLRHMVIVFSLGLAMIGLAYEVMDSK